MELYFVIGIVIIALMLFGYTHFLIEQLRSEYRKTTLAYTTYQTLVVSDLSDPAMEGVKVNLSRDIGETINFPSVVTDPEGTPLAWWPGYNKYLGKDPDENLEIVKKFAADLDRINEPIPIVRYTRDPETGNPVGAVSVYFHYGEPVVVKLLYWVPTFELALILIFAFVGIVSYRRVKTSEQQAIWTGMAREAAHQLGTPVSSLLGWHAILTEKCGSDPGAAGPLGEIGADITRLEKVAARFQEIGAPVPLVPTDIVPLIEAATAYGRRRLPVSSDAEIRTDLPESLIVPFNPLLLEWVIENLVKNAVDAVQGTDGGLINVSAVRKNGGVEVTVSDNGVGIGTRDLDQIFNPGYTTKPKGWGLGLALVKRVVEDVHGGEAKVESSAGGGATFTVFIPGETAKK
ncbi:MAG: HAMP domain-containing histidine kinase [Candidatus Coatesbacteria bacterium]|nr:MAG: HAMP domain-containing histidine kinase [Candidatus Coatesbacteria bacterium]